MESEGSGGIVSKRGTPMAKQRTPYQLPPRYDIDALLDRSPEVGGGASAVDAVWAAIEEVPESTEHDYYRPDSALLEPEVVVGDVCRSASTMGNGFSVSLGYSGGILCFSRALRSLRVVGYREAVEVMETVADVLGREGYRVFTTFPEDPIYGWLDEWGETGGCLDWEAEQRVEAVAGRHGRDLDSRWWAVDRQGPAGGTPLDRAVCGYLEGNRELLRCRKSGGG